VSDKWGTEDDLSEEMTSPTERTIRILELVAAKGPLSLADIISSTKIPRPTVARLVGNLEGIGYLQKQSRRGHYGVGYRFIQTAQDTISGALTQAPINSLLTELSKQLGESVSLAILRAGEVIYIDNVASDSPLTFRFQSGLHTSLHCSSSGHLFLADMNQDQFDNYLKTGPWQAVTPKTITSPAKLKKVIISVQKRGYATNSSGLVEGVAGIAVPVIGSNGRTIAALSVAAPTTRKSIVNLEAHLPKLKDVALRLGQILLLTS
jgi:IclR family acetate operon transcriptional repressor